MLERDKKNEARVPDGRRVDRASGSERDRRRAVPRTQSARKRPALETTHPDLRPAPTGVGATTLDGTRAAVRTVIRYRNGVLEGRGASLLDGYMEDLATDRIYRLMIAQRLRYPGPYTPSRSRAIFDEELARILAELPAETNAETRGRYRKAREISEAMILRGAFDPT